MSYDEKEERPTRLGLIQARVQKALKERLAPGRVEKEVDKLATEFIEANVEKVLGIAFGFESRWDGEYELHRGFEKGAIAAKLNEMLTSPEVMKFVEDAIGDFRKHIKVKALREWQKKYREAYLEAYWEKADELIDLNAKRHGQKDAEEEFYRLLREKFNTEAEIPQGHPLSGEENEGEEEP